MSIVSHLTGCSLTFRITESAAFGADCYSFHIRTIFVSRRSQISSSIFIIRVLSALLSISALIRKVPGMVLQSVKTLPSSRSPKWERHALYFVDRALSKTIGDAVEVQQRRRNLSCMRDRVHCVLTLSACVSLRSMSLSRKDLSWFSGKRSPLDSPYRDARSVKFQVKGEISGLKSVNDSEKDY